MTGPDLYLERLHVDRMPGFPPTRAFTVGNMSPGINIIHGPNESGKTTVARAISIAVHGASLGDGRPEVRGRLSTGDGPYEVRVEVGQRTILEAGEPAADLDLPPAAAADRYRLWLHELLQAEDPNRDFAEQILHETRGGYDIRAAREELGFRASPSAANISERRDYSTKDRELKELRREVTDPVETERRLEELYHERERLRGERERAAALEQAGVYREHQDVLEAAERKLAELPDALEKVTGEEPDRLDRLREEQDEAEDSARDARHAIDAAREQLEDAGLPDDEPSGDLVPTLRQRVQRLQGYKDTIDRLERELRGVEERVEEARDALGEITDPEALEEVDTELVRRADEIAEQAEKVHQDTTILEAVEEWLSGEEPPVDAEGIAEAVRELLRWLQQPDGFAVRQRPLWWIGLAGGVLTAAAGGGAIALALVGAAAQIAGIVGVVLFLLGLVLLYFWWRSGRDSEQTGTRETYERGFRRTGIDPPSSWQREAVEDRLDQLNDQLVEVQLWEEREQQRLKLAPDREDLRERKEEVEARVEEMGESFGVALDLTERSFLWFVRQLAEWQKARSDRARVHGELDEARAQRESLVEEIARDLAPYGYEEFDDAEAALAQVEDLDRRIRSFQEAKNGIDQAEEDESEARQRAEKRESEIRELFEELGLEPGDDAGLRRLCGRLEEYQAATEERSNAKPLREQALEDLRGEPGYEERMEEMGQTEIEAELDELGPELDRLEELQDEIPTLEERIRSAKQEDRVEAALEARDRALAALRDKMEEETARVVGWAVAEHVHERTRDHDLPAVFRRARELLATFTRGRYRLQFTDSEPPEFRALDTWHDETKALDELSSGTRVQLLLAVRLAFVEQQEQGPKLPLLLDETLANSDDVRARAIIQAVVEVSRDGRQVFYLTAQKDEVEKWKFVLGENGGESPPFGVIDLAQERSITRDPDALSLDVSGTPFEVVTPPENRSHAEYGSALGVPLFDPAREIGATHLWYFVEDLQLLHFLLDRGIERWGELETLRAESAELDAVLPDETWSGIRARAKVLSAYRSAWSVGRGKPVGRAVLEEADGVTSTKIDEVTEVAERVDGDAGALLDALERGEVSYFRIAQREKLEGYLLREGYLVEESRLSAEEIQEETIDAVSDEIEAGLLEREEVRMLLERAQEEP